MSKFKFSEKERKELDDLISNVLEYKGDREYFIGEIESILSAPSEPSETGGAEEVWNIAEGILDKCRCEPIYANRKMVDPNCAWCEYHVDFIQAMTTYAAQRCADKDREANNAFESLKFAYDNKCELIESDISEANKRIEYIDSHRLRLIESVKKWGGAWRKCRAELKEAKRRIAELEEQNKDNNFLLNEIDAWFSFNNQPSVKEIASMRKSIQEKMK